MASRILELEPASEVQESPEKTSADDGRGEKARRGRRASSPPLVAKGVRQIMARIFGE